MVTGGETGVVPAAAGGVSAGGCSMRAASVERLTGGAVRTAAAAPLPDDFCIVW